MQAILLGLGLQRKSVEDLQVVLCGHTLNLFGSLDPVQCFLVVCGFGACLTLYVDGTSTG